VGSGAGKGASWELDSLPEQQRRGWDQGQVKEQVGSWTHSLNSRGEGGIRGRQRSKLGAGLTS
jgi:hypothetical protein